MDGSGDVGVVCGDFGLSSAVDDGVAVGGGDFFHLGGGDGDAALADTDVA